jgi:hypothetical protein
MNFSFVQLFHCSLSIIARITIVAVCVRVHVCVSFVFSSCLQFDRPKKKRSSCINNATAAAAAIDKKFNSINISTSYVFIHFASVDPCSCIRGRANTMDFLTLSVSHQSCTFHTFRNQIYFFDRLNSNCTRPSFVCSFLVL